MNILFLGEHAGGSAEYARQSLIHLNHTVSHVDARHDVPSIHTPFDAFIISDYPAAKLSPDITSRIIDQVKSGSRLIMVGGWASFAAMDGSFRDHSLSEYLPVSLSDRDDRQNVPQGLILSFDNSVKSLPNVPALSKSPPVICGYNAANPKPGARTLVWMNPIESDGVSIRFSKPIPLVIKHSVANGVSIACLTDLAPHWCGGLVDWGSPDRLSLPPIEIGALFPPFLNFLLSS